MKAASRKIVDAKDHGHVVRLCVYRKRLCSPSAVRLFNYGGQTEQTQRERARAVVRGHKLCIMPPLSRRGAEPFELQPRRDSCPFFQATRNARRNRGRKARHGCLSNARDRKRRLKIMLAVPSSR